MLFFIAVTNVLSDREEARVLEVVLVSRVGSIGDGVPLGRDVGGTGRLTSRLSHSLGGGVISAVDVAAKAGVLEGVFSFGGVDVGSRQSIEADSLSFDDFSVGRWAREDLVGEMELESVTLLRALRPNIGERVVSPGLGV